MEELDLTSLAVGRNVRALRKRNGWNWSELSRQLEKVGRWLAPTPIQRLERGERRVNVDDLTAFARVFNVSVTDLLCPGQQVYENTDSYGALVITDKYLSGIQEEITAFEADAWIKGKLKSFTVSDRLEYAKKEIESSEKKLNETLKEIEDADDEQEEHLLFGCSQELEQEIFYLTKHLENLKKEI